MKIVFEVIYEPNAGDSTVIFAEWFVQFDAAPQTTSKLGIAIITKYTRFRALTALYDDAIAEFHITPTQMGTSQRFWKRIKTRLCFMELTEKQKKIKGEKTENARKKNRKGTKQ